MNEVIAFIPGWGFTANIWKPLASKLADQTICCDLPSVDSEEYNESTVNKILNNLNESLPDNCVLVGWSLGGLIALSLAKRFTKKFKKIVLIASTPKFVESEHWHGIQQKEINDFYIAAKTDLARLQQHFLARVLYPVKDVSLIQSNQIMHMQNNAAWIFYLQMLKRADLRNFHQKTNIPILQIFGGADLIVSRNCAKQVMNIREIHKNHVIKNAGHAPFLTHESIVINQLIEFVHADE